MLFRRTTRLITSRALYKPLYRPLLVGLTCLVCLLGSVQLPAAIAHNLEQSYLYFQIAEDALSARAELPVQDLSKAMNLGLPAGKRVSKDDLAPYLETIKDYVAEHASIDCAPQSCEMEFQDYDLMTTYQSQFLLLNYNITGFQALPEALQVTYDVILKENPQYTNMLLIEENWKTGTFGNEANALLVFDKPGQIHTLDLTSGSLFQGFLGVVKLGIQHILEGIDHVLFLVALLLPSVLRRQPKPQTEAQIGTQTGLGKTELTLQDNTRWQPVGKFSSAFIYILKIATAFTVAHSITLCLATLQIVQVPSRIVESIIAASIGLAAIEIFYPIFRGRAWLIIFLFGLFHGFGFADVLAELGVTSQHAALSLFGFNLGVEIGQLAIIAVVFPVLYLLRKQRFYRKLVLWPGGLVLGAMSLYWFVERAFDINLQVMPMLQGFL